MTIIGTPPTLTAEQADDLLDAAMRAGRVPLGPVDEHEPIPGGTSTCSRTGPRS